MAHKVYMPVPTASVSLMFKNRGWEITSFDEADVIQFTGGADISPSLYGELPHHLTTCVPQRDMVERAVFLKAVEKKKVIAGICRGGQFLNVMNGGRLWQDVDEHGTTHPIHVLAHKFFDIKLERTIQATSTHHQMMIPASHAELIAYAKRSKYKTTVDSKGRPTKIKVDGTSNKDAEILYYRDTKSICFQPHPEYSHASKDLTNLYFQLIS